MSRFFFDIHDGFVSHDEKGTELDDVQAVRAAAMAALPKVAADEISTDGVDSDRRHFTVLVTDEDGHPVYSAPLTYTGLWLLRWGGATSMPVSSVDRRT